MILIGGDSAMADTFYVTTPIYYANDKPHIGHVYTTVVADTLNRFKRQRGIDSFFLTGTDEHGVNIERAAAARGIPIEQHIDNIVARFKAAFEPLDLDYDRWIRTTDSFHEAGVQQLWRVLEKNGHIYKGEYHGWFCSYCNEFKDVDDGAVEPQCPIHDRPLDRISEESYFFRLSQFQQPLLDLYRSNPQFVQPESRLNEVASFVAGGLKDLSISRSTVKWGIPVPGDPGHTMYVWFDALANYITALGWGNDAYHDFDRYWPATHLVGKDIVRFHAVYWPAFLLGAGIQVPKQVRAHGMWLSGGRKMSKTLGNTVDLDILYKHFTSDMIRYFLLREMAFGQDGDFTYGALIDRVNSDLADGIGNLASRTLTMIRNYFGGTAPRNFDQKLDSTWIEDAAEVQAAVEQARSKFDSEFGEMNFSRALEAAWVALSRVDKYISDNKPWKLAKESESRETLAFVLTTAYEALRHLVPLLTPVLPRAAAKIWSEMGQAGEPLKIDPNSLVWAEQIAVQPIDTISPAFPKLAKDQIMTSVETEKAKVDEQIEGATSAGEQPAAVVEAGGSAPGEGPADAVIPGLNPPLAPTITIDDFVKVDLRVATILQAERIPKSDKLLRIQVDIGEAEPRQVLAGIAEHYAPEEIVGRRIIVVANLAPRKMRGLESNGMLLAASGPDDGKPMLATVTEDVPNGTRLK